MPVVLLSLEPGHSGCGEQTAAAAGTATAAGDHATVGGGAPVGAAAAVGNCTIIGRDCAAVGNSTAIRADARGGRRGGCYARYRAHRIAATDGSSGLVAVTTQVAGSTRRIS